MNNLNNFSVSNRCSGKHSCSLLLVMLILIFTSCTNRSEPFTILEFTGADDVSNYSKSLFQMINISDSMNPTPVIGSRGDLFVSGEYLFLYDSPSSAQNRFLFKSIDNALYVDDKIYSIDIPNNDDMIPWFENMKERDFSALQFISFDTKIQESYLPYLTEVAKIKPDAGLVFSGDFEDMTGLFKIFKPRIIAGPILARTDYDQLSKLTNLKILMVSLSDSIITEPLPAIPELEQLFLTSIGEDVVLTNNYLLNNKQIKRVIIQRSGSFDFSILKPLNNLKELVVNVSDEIKNSDLINNHKKLEVLSVTGDSLVLDPSLIRLPFLRWMTFSSYVTQDEFSTFIDTHPDIEVIELISNETIRSLQPLSKLSKLIGLTLTDTVTDIESVKTLGNLKYLSLPGDFLDDPVNKAEIQKSLPGTRIVANEGFCLGSGWLLLIIPFVLIIRFLGRHKRHILQDGVKP